MRYYFQLQKLMISRNIRAFGLNPLFALLLGLIGFVVISEVLFVKSSFAHFMYLGLAIFALSKLSEMRRNEFIKSVFLRQDYFKIRLLENALIITPFVVFLLVKNQMIWTLLLGLFSVVMSRFSYKQKFILNIPSPFSRYPFEFSIGFRKYLPLIIAAVCLLSISIFVDNPNLGLFSLLIIPYLTMSFYAYPENEFYVWMHSLSAKQFLKHKISIALFYLACLMLPFLIGYAIFFWFKINLALAIFFLGLFNISVFILAKYTAYPSHINLPQSLLIIIGIVFPPFLIVSLPYFYKKAYNNLQGLLV